MLGDTRINHHYHTLVGGATHGGFLFVHPEVLSSIVTGSCGHYLFLKQKCYPKGAIHRFHLIFT